MSGLYLTDMARWFRDAGLDVIESGGWQARARSSGGYAAGRPWLVMWHHTAGGGNPDGQVNSMLTQSAAPIANFAPDFDGVIRLMAAGATNTNGKGVATTVSRGTVPADSMNTFAVGMEIMNNGVGQAYPQVQIDACFAASLAITRNLGLQPDDVGVHAVYSPGRKIDPARAAVVQGPWRPGGFNGSSDSWLLDDLRAELRRRAGIQPPVPTPPTPIPPGVFDMASTVLILDDVRDPLPRYRCGPDTKSWVQDGNASAQVNARLAECAGGTQPSPVDGMVYVLLAHGGDDVIASYGPIVGPLPPNRDEFGRAT